MAADDLVSTLQHYTMAPPPGIKIGDPVMQGVKQIEQILKTMYPLPPPAPSMSPTVAPIIPHPIILPSASSKISTHLLPPVQTPEERLYQYYLDSNKALAPPSVSVPVSRVVKPPIINPPAVVALPMVKKKVIAKTPSPQQNIDVINDLIAQYNSIAKDNSPTKKITTLPLRKSNIPPMYIPTKSIKPCITAPPKMSRLNTQLSKLRTLQRNNGTTFKKSAARQLVAQHVFAQLQMNNVFNNITGRRETLSTLLTRDTATTWATSLANELGRLSKGITNRVVGTDTIDLICQSEVPVGVESNIW